jgi:hypothetical protein
MIFGVLIKKEIAKQRIQIMKTVITVSGSGIFILFSGRK